MTKNDQNIAQKAVLILIKGYKLFLSPVMGHGCRFVPTCSDYMAQAVMKYGALKGVWLGTVRLLKCHPWSGPGGHDPVP